MGKLTGDMLLKALKEGKSYAETKPFIQAISAGESYIIEIINNTFLSILTSDKAALMSKLLVLRMYKDIFITGNIEMFDKIDPEVEDIIISAAAYNAKYKPKGKVDTRGAMYFIDTEKRPKNQQTAKLGHSFVILATQIIKFFAIWLPEGPDQSPSRFVEIYEQLTALGVQFNTNSYFTPEQEKIFKKNYVEWKQKFDQNKQNTHQKNISSEKKVSNKQKQQVQYQKQNKKAQKKRNSQAEKPSSEQISEQQIQKLTKKYEQKIKTLEQEKQKTFNEIKYENDRKIQKISEEMTKKDQQIVALKQCNVIINQQNKKLMEKIANQEKNKSSQQVGRNQAVQKIRNQKEQLERDLLEEKQQKKAAFSQIKQLQTQITDLNKKLTTLKQALKQSQSILKQPDPSLQKQSKDFESLNKQFQKLKNEREKELKQKESLTLKLKEQGEELNQLKKKIEQLKKESEQIENKYSQNSLHVKASMKREKVRKNAVLEEEKEGIFVLGKQQQNVVSDENKRTCDFILEKLESKKKINNIEGQIVDEPKKQQFLSVKNIKQLDPNNMSLSNFLNAELKNETKNEDKFYKTDFPVKKTSNSLHKTENSKIRWENHTLKSNNCNKQNLAYRKTQNCFFKTNNFRKHKETVTSVFPFLKDYFAPIQINKYIHFRACCLLEEARTHPFFEDQLIQLRISKKKRKTNKIILSLVNKMPYRIEAKMLLETAEVYINESESSLKLLAFGEQRVTVVINVTNLNFRFPVLKLSVKSGYQKQIDYNIPLPITLLDCVELLQVPQLIQNFEKFEETEYKKYRSERIIPNNMMKNLPMCFPQLYFEKNAIGKYLSCSIVRYPKIPQIQVKLTIVSCQQFVQFETQFVSHSKFSQAFAKVFIQVLMFIFI